MKRIQIPRFCITCLLTGVISGSALAASSYSFSVGNQSSSSKPRITTNRPWGNLGAFKQPPKYEQSPPPASNAYYPAAAPGNSWYPAQRPVAATATTNTQPRVEVEISGRTFYEQQNIVYTARVISTDNLKTLNAVLPQVEGAVLEQIDGPVASERNAGRNREIVNEYHFKLMPLQSGKIEIPAIRFTGTHAASSRQWRGIPGMPAAADSSFSIAADQPLTLMVLPAEPSVMPWLPLHDLKLRAQMPEERPAKEGIPVTLTLELTARGALGKQLPSLERQLKSDSFRVYRDSTTTSSGVSNDGEQLLGSRKETYTLIPLRDGWIRLPQIRVAWWDVDTDSAMVAGLAGQDSMTATLNTQQAVTTDGTFSGWFWVPWLVTVSLILGYWLGAWARTRPVLRMARAKARVVFLAAGHQLQGTARLVGKKLSPVLYWNRLRLGFALLMPKSARLWMCTRCLEQEDTPEAWCQQFMDRVCQQLNINKQTPLPLLAEKIIEANPQAEPARVRALAQSLDGAIYGGRPLDFPAWKRDFRQQVRPRLLRRHRQRTRRTGATLPALNPRSA